MRKITLLVLLFSAILTYGQTTTIDFDNDANWTASDAGSISSYQDGHSYVDGVFSATAMDALRQQSGDQDGFPSTLGDYSWRLRNNDVTSWTATIASGGVENFSVAVRRWDGSPSPDFNLEYSVDGGGNWEFVSLINNTTLNESSDWTTFSATVGSDADNILVRIVPNASGERIMIDDFEWTAFTSIPSSPTTSAPTPTEDEANVVSIYSDTYTNVSIADFDPFWGQPVDPQVNTTFDPTGDGTNFALEYVDFTYQGTQFDADNANALDLSDMDYFHVDIWVPEGTDRQVRVSPINFGTGVGEVQVEVPLTPGSWNSVTLDKADFTDMTWDAVNQLIFNGQFNGDGSANTTPFNIYLDNIYFSAEPTSTGTGEDCSTALVVDQMPYTNSGTTADFGNNYAAADRPALGGEQYVDGTGADSYLNGPDVVYSFTPDEDGVFNFDLSSSVDGWISFWLFQGCEPFTSIVARHTSTTGDTRSFPEINLTAGETYYVVISGWTVGTGPESYDYTLDISQITCPVPFDVTLNSSDLTSADFSWSEISTADSYDWFVVETGADIEEPANIIASGNSTSNSDNITGLTAATVYDFYVSADCGDGDESDLSDPVQFATACDTFGDFENDFSSEIADNVPLCWTGSTTSTGLAPNLEVTTIGSPQFGSQQVRLQSSGDAATEHYLISPELNNLGTVDKRLRVTARQLSATGSNVIEVGVMSDPTDESTFTVVETITFNGNELADYDVILDEGTTENYFAFRATFSGTFQTIYIDRVIYEDNPSCIEPSGLTETAVGLDFIDVEWDAVEGVDDYEIVYGEEGFDPDTEGDVFLVEGLTNATISDLDDDTIYDIYARSLCSDTDISNWSDVLQITTLIEGATCEVAIPITSLPYNTVDSTSNYGDNYDGSAGTDCGSTSNYLSGDDVVYTYTATSNGSLDVSLSGLSDTYAGIFVYESCEDIGTACANGALNGSSTDDLEFILSVEENQEYIFVISTWPSPQTTDFTLDIQEILCTAPTSLQFDGIGTSSVDFSWTGADGEDDYNWFIYEAGADPETDTPTDSGVVSETNAFSDAFLVEGVNSYDVYIQTDCGDSQSELVGPFNFNVSACEVEDQCVYVFELTDSWGDGWNGNTMDVLQDGEVVATIGSDFTSGDSFTEEVTLCSDVDFELYWNDGGGFANEVGVEIIDPDGSSVYTKNPGDGSQDSSLFTGVACPEPVFANVQVIHNSPDPAAASVDVYLNGALLPELTSVSFREASAFLAAPANEDITVDVVPAGGELSESVFNQTFNLEEDENYIIVANGVLDTDSFATDNAFELTAYAGARTVAENAEDVDILVHHGSPDAPAVDVNEPDAGNLVSNISYPEFQGYLSVPEADYTLEIAAAGSPDAIVSYAAPLATLGGFEGNAITVVASGFFGDDAGDDNGFGLWVATAAGGPLVELPLIEPDPVFANMQVIHNSPDPAASSVDVYLNGQPSLLMGVDFRTASPYVLAPANEDFTVDVVPAGGELSESVYTEVFNLEEDNYVLVANGVLDPSEFEDASPFEISVYQGARTAAENDNEVDILVHHGSPDAPAVDVNESSIGNLISDIAYPEFQGYLSVPEAEYTLEIAPAGVSEPIASYTANLGDLVIGGVEGQSITILASGFFGNDAGENNGFGLWVALSDGGPLIELPLITSSTIDFNDDNFTYYPNPVKSTIKIEAKNNIEQVEVFNMLGQRILVQNPNNTNPSLNMSNMESGVYMMKVSINGAEKSFQIIKE